MIKSFLDPESEQLYITGKSRKIPSTIHKVALRKLDYINGAYSLDDLRIPPANRLERLQGNLKEFYSIRINKQYRVIFKFKNENAYDIKITDYH